jgi:diaminohydroxyphosphoribosylaminopyrimidine deaminase/5-amino-6-(5-phosphoribosylamino)uracil reductase
LPAGADAAVGIADLLAALGKRGLQSLIVEGGSRVHGAFVAARAVDEVTLFLAPRLVGGGLPIAAGADLPIARGLHLGPLRTEPLDGDILLTASAVAER